MRSKFSERVILALHLFIFCQGLLHAVFGVKLRVSSLVNIPKVEQFQKHLKIYLTFILFKACFKSCVMTKIS